MRGFSVVWHPRSMALETKSDAAGQGPTILRDAVAKFRVRLAHPLRGRRDSNTPARTISVGGWLGRCGGPRHGLCQGPGRGQAPVLQPHQRNCNSAP